MNKSLRVDCRFRVAANSQISETKHNIMNNNYLNELKHDTTRQDTLNLRRVFLKGIKTNYFVSRCGSIYNYNNIKIKSHINKGGYEQISIWFNNKGNTLTVHRLVAIAFIINPLQKPEVNHIDGNKLNNNACNLEWCTPIENITHALNIGLKKRKKTIEKKVKLFNSIVYDNKNNIVYNEFKNDLPIKEHNGWKFVNYNGSKIGLSKIPILQEETEEFNYIFNYGFRK